MVPLTNPAITFISLLLLAWWWWCGVWWSWWWSCCIWHLAAVVVVVVVVDETKKDLSGVPGSRNKNSKRKSAETISPCAIFFLLEGN